MVTDIFSAEQAPTQFKRVVVEFDASQVVDVARINARNVLYMIGLYLNDLKELYNGDVNRFGRMVDGRGGGSGSESGWREKVKQLLSNKAIFELFPLEANARYAEAASIGIVESRKPTECPYCHSANIECSLGRWVCADCESEGSY